MGIVELVDMNAASQTSAHLGFLSFNDRKTQLWTWIFTLISVLLIILGTIGLVVLQKPLQQSSFDNRQQAAEIRNCNEACDHNAQCPVNHLCYQGRCRLADNPSDTDCQGVPDQGLDFGCDHYCADTRECDDDFICLENRCRRSDNPDDQFCRPSDETIQQNIKETCNESCSSHADCEVNMRCYGGSCRLASNPGSFECLTQAEIKTMMPIKTQPKTSPSPEALPKGGPDATASTEATDAAKSATPAAIVRPPSPSPTAQPTPLPTPLPEEETALDALLNSLRKAGVPVDILPILALAAGGIMLLVILVPKFFQWLQSAKKQGSLQRPQSSVQRPPQASPQNPPLVSTRQKQKQTPNELNQSVPTLETGKFERPVKPQPTNENPIRREKPPTNGQPLTNGQPVSGQPSNDSKEKNASSMIDRIKQKNIKPPNA